MKRILVLKFAISTVVAVAGLLYGCSGGSGPASGPQLNTAPPVSGPFGLPGPAELAAATNHTRNVSAARLSCTGSEHLAEFEQRAAVEGTDLRFTPEFDEQHRALDGVAYAIYRFNLQGVELTHKLSISWAAPPENTTDLWLGLSRWEKGWWEWRSAFTSESQELTYSAKTLYSEPASGDLYIVVLLTGTAEAVLEQLSLDGNSAISAHLVADPVSGEPPLLVSFDASGSTSPAGSIVKYEWDWDGDGHFDEDTEDTPTASHEYAAGNYTARVKVTDELGGEATASATISIAVPTIWPMFGHDAQRTRRSQYVGAQTNNVKWSYTTAGEVWSSPAIGADGTVYVSSFDGNFYAINPNGSQKWSYDLSDYEHDTFLSSPAIGLDGTLYIVVPTNIGSWDTVLYAITPAGSLKWTYDVGGDASDVGSESPTIGTDGTVYVRGADENNQSGVHAVNPDGSLKWTYLKDGRARNYPVIGLDGTVYQSFIQHIAAINPDGSLKWEYVYSDEYAHTLLNSPAIGADGVIYVSHYGAKVLTALTPEGSLKWFYDLPFRTGRAVIGTDDTVYVKSEWGNGVLSAVNPDGSLMWEWEYDTGSGSTPAIGADGTLYFGCGPDVYALNSNGSVKWSYTTGAKVNSSPAIGADGTVYIGSNDGKLYAFGP